ncbi:methyltransferase domain-containing protein [Nocardia yunnanensis]|uniref:Methyltransferase domain-containing protein n=1 Tax=Nocardia yunnanensis TaxID=2382165 RepID=A0A386Z903_9NOCA|nr:methyltransferase domain-containing protein [Nocardia yunnanensis]AYF74116.1 methyltransferase domain-containing protein [Nocardia yunnanensis]
MNPIVARLMSTVGGQLGNPHGVLGKGVARFLNRGNRPMIEAAVAAAEVSGADAAADIGFGGGIGLTLLLARVGSAGTVTGVELSPDMLRRAHSVFAHDLSAGRLKLTAGSLTDLPLPDASMDAVITCNTVYFVSDLERACTELARVLRPKGRLVIGIGDPDVMAKMPFAPYGFIHRPVPELIATMQRAGLTVDHRDVAGKPIPSHLLIGRPTDA